jgi:hypothetical protein
VKTLLLSCLVLLSAVYTVRAQDPGMMAAQAAQQANDMAMQATQQANMAAMQASQQASQDAMQASQNAALNQGPAIAITRMPKFSAAAGKVAAGTLVRMKSPTHYSTIYYTTNGWTPTPASKRYVGPVRVNHDMVLQAIAVSSSMGRSFITQAEYTIPGGGAARPVAVNTDGVLRSGTRIELSTAATADSKTAQIGDALLLRLDQDVTVGDRVVIPKGMPVDALITLADHAGHVGAAGEISFEIQALVANGITIPLRGGETLEGTNHIRRTMGIAMAIPFVGIASLLQHGEQAVIKPGMSLSAVVTADTPLTPTAAR